MSNYAQYGYIDGEVSSDDEVVVIVNRGSVDSRKPEHDIMRFSTKLRPSFGKLYIYNAVWSAESVLTISGMPNNRTII